MPGEAWRPRLAGVTPRVLKDWRRAVVMAAIRRRNAGRSAERVFADIYAEGRWGAGETFDSGTGSRGELAIRYAEYVRSLVQRLGVRSVVDVGCGDFRVAGLFADHVESYHGVDVVPAVIARNNELHGAPGVRFSVLDATVRPLPEGDLCLVRQVLQHLSNRQIAGILAHCRQFPTVLVTEHWPAPDRMRRPNIDKPHGPDIRLDRGSWVDITRPPFDCRPVREVLRLSLGLPLFRSGETVRTFLWQPSAGA
ncbi:class I SAM-dependent methyltransferase [Micromonospora zhanjiangensis]|uniref:Class I SAM-dependent methyltransferase n=1 Tax=Micromonospora zhanjiangensis TaxID=1522057 RepID=A0ABV8KIK6_9ACTN